MIIAIYNEESYVHMLPMHRVFTSIRDACVFARVCKDSASSPTDTDMKIDMPTLMPPTAGISLPGDGRTIV
jgi:hypothetical protein